MWVLRRVELFEPISVGCRVALGLSNRVNTMQKKKKKLKRNIPSDFEASDSAYHASNPYRLVLWGNGVGARQGDDLER